MIAGAIVVFRGQEDEPETEAPVLIELTEWDTQVEITVEAGPRRIYLRFRLEDLIREVKEARAA